ncbi:MAG: hypothetical protein ACXABY_25600 [Candidatus Thorarchaeota archaeon]
MKTEPSNNRLERFGFSYEHGSTHMARTMMLNEMSLLLDYVSEPSSASDAYARAIEEDNCLGKRLGAQEAFRCDTFGPCMRLIRTKQFFDHFATSGIATLWDVP